MAGIRMEFLFLLIVVHVTNAQTYYSLFQTKADCKNGPSDLFHEFYDAVSMTCQPCSENNTLQKVSSDGKCYSCMNKSETELVLCVLPVGLFHSTA